MDYCKNICCDQHVLLTKLCSPLPCFILYSNAKVICYSRYLLTSYFCIRVPYNEQDVCVCVCVCVLLLEGLVGLHRNIQLQLFQHYWLEHRLALLLYEWFALETVMILSFLRVHPCTAFQTLLLTMRATPLLLRDF